MLEVRGVSVIYEDGTVALEDVSFKLPRGCVMAVLGPNGAGKTTLVKVLIGVVKPVKGEVLINGKAPDKHIIAKLVGYVPQKAEIDPLIPLTAREVIEMGLLGKFPSLSLRRYSNKIFEVAKLLGIEDLLNVPFQHLSGGQQQRVLIARALVRDPEILLLDEPFTGIDVVSTRKIIQVLKELRDAGKTIIVVTHTLELPATVADYVLFLNRRVVAFGPTREVFTHENILKTFGGAV